MKLYQGRFSDELVWEEEVYFEEQLDNYILVEDSRDYYLDDDSCDIELYDEVDAQDQKIFVAWCKQENKKPSHMASLAEYMRLEAE